MKELLGERKNQVVLGLLVTMVGMAGYLNHIDRNGEVASINSYESILLTDEGDVITTLGDGLLLPTYSDETTTLTTANSNVIEPAGDAVFVSSNTQDPFFLQVKLEREQARAKEKDFLVEIINNDHVAEAEKKEAAGRMLNIQERIEKETATESMIEAKGFKDVYVRIDDETVDVIVSKETLTESELAQIEDIVKRKTGFEASNIRISTFKVSE